MHKVARMTMRELGRSINPRTAISEEHVIRVLSELDLTIALDQTAPLAEVEMSVGWQWLDLCANA